MRQWVLLAGIALALGVLFMTEHHARAQDGPFPIELQVGESFDACASGQIVCPARAPICDDPKVVVPADVNGGLGFRGVGPGTTLCSAASAVGPRATAIFRIVQEALTNVMRHAAASQVNVILGKKDDTLILEVKDNGIGIKEERIFNSKSLGLTGIRERVLLLGGEAIISGKPGEGTVVRVTLPFEEGAISNT